ncbi:MAG: hypothetical protein DWH82_10435, partial [Planctomycetota bacterium]
GENRKGGWYGRPGWPPGFRPVGFFTTGFFEPGGFAEGGMEELLEFLPSFSSRSLIRFSVRSTQAENSPVTWHGWRTHIYPYPKCTIIHPEAESIFR